jgi:flagellar M-ring protein FliF
VPDQLKILAANIQALGPRRLGLMAAITALVMIVVGAGAYYLNRPAFETLYVGLDRSDVNQIGVVLAEMGIDYNVGSDGSSVMVPVGRTGNARMLLAERGLPSSANAGYELFDNVGSLGLTSFMQQVTKVRALEGEIARTIQSIAGIKAARVHIVMAERANFRRDEQQPSASVVIRTSGGDPVKSALSIRQLVAAAVPGLSADKVTVLDSSGALLAAGDDPSSSALNRSIGVERTVEGQIEENIARALSPYLGRDNFRASVKAVVNTDARQTEEVIFDPDSRVERSVQVVRSTDSASQQSAAAPTTVQQNLPEEELEGGDGPRSQENRERREETTNYELNSKRIATVSGGFAVSRMSVSVVVNRERLTSILGPDATPEQIGQRIEEIKTMVSTAAGFDQQRGDLIHVAAVEFLADSEMEALAGPGMLDRMTAHVGTLINAAAFILVAFLVAWFGLRPMAAALNGPATAADGSFESVQRSLAAAQDTPMLADGGGQEEPLGLPGRPESIDDLRRKLKPAPQDRLQRMVDLNEERTAHILRKWASREAVS